MPKINEIFFSIQGEGTKAGEPCVFVRFTYCNLRCTYCDTEYAFYEGKDLTNEEIINEIRKYKCSLVEITGGEPLVQKDDCFLLMKTLSDIGYEVMIETSGSISIADIDKRVKIIMDLKCPSSGMQKKNLFDNLNYLKPTDEIKFVIANREDYNWSKNILSKFNLEKRCIILFSTVFDKIQPVEIVNWILEDNLKVKFQLQLHKYIWPSQTKGV
jgi:7-carboxy-7-deazaguanine synthase